MGRFGITLLSGVALLSGLGGCQRQEASAPFIAQGIGEGDVKFITDGYNIIKFDLDESALVPSHTRDPEVRAMASYLTQVGSHYRDLIRPAAERRGIEPPQVIMPELAERLRKTDTLARHVFDRAYVGDQIYSHQTIFDHAATLVGETQDPDLNRLLRETFGQLQQSLQRLHALEAKLAAR